MSLYLNDIPLDTFLKYFNSNNLSKAGNWNYVTQQASSKLYIHSAHSENADSIIYTYDNKLIINNDTTSDNYIDAYTLATSLGLEGEESVMYTDTALPIYYSAIYAKYGISQFYIVPAPYSLLTYKNTTLPEHYFYYNNVICFDDGTDKTSILYTNGIENPKYKNINLVKYISVDIDGTNIVDYYSRKVLYRNINLKTISQNESDYYDSKHINRYANAQQFEQYRDINNYSYILYKNNPIEKYDTKIIVTPETGYKVGHSYIKMHNSQTGEDKYFDMDEIPDSTFNRYINMYRQFRSAKYKSNKYTMREALNVFDYGKPIYVENDIVEYLVKYQYTVTYNITKLSYDVENNESIIGNLIDGYSKSQFKYSSILDNGITIDDYITATNLDDLEAKINDKVNSLQQSEIYCRNPLDPEEFYIVKPRYSIITNIVVYDDTLSNILAEYSEYTSRTEDEYAYYYWTNSTEVGKELFSIKQRILHTGKSIYNSKISEYNEKIKKYFINDNRYFILADYTGTKLNTNNNYERSACFAIANYTINDQNNTRYSNTNKLDPNYIYCQYYYNKALFKLYTQKGLKNDNNLNTGTYYRVDDRLNYGFIKLKDFNISNEIVFDDIHSETIIPIREQTAVLNEIAESDDTNLYTRLVEYTKFPLNIDRYKYELNKSTLINGILSEKITAKSAITKTTYPMRYNNISDSIPNVIHYLSSLYEFTCKSTDLNTYTLTAAEFYNFANYDTINKYYRSKDIITNENSVLEKYKIYYGTDADANKKTFETILKYKVLNSLNLNTSTELKQKTTEETTKEDGING